MRQISSAIMAAAFVCCGTLLLINNDPIPGWIVLGVACGLAFRVGLGDR